MRKLPLLVFTLILATAAQAGQQLPKNNKSGDDGFVGSIGATVSKSKMGDNPDTKYRKGSPNVVYIVLDDVGFSDLGCYGSEISTPNLDRLASTGVRFNNFHTRAICSPTRASLLTGRNSHTVGVNTVADLTNGFPNGRGRISPHAATLAQILQDAGYATFALGKWHLVPGPERSVAGPFMNWPLQKGFDHFYGFLGGLTDQFHPELCEDNTPIDAPAAPGYHLSEDLVDRSMAYIQSVTTSTAKKPFFLYLAFGAAHAPHQAPRQYVDKYVPVFEKGWDMAREQRFEHEKQLGVIPQSAKLAPTNPGVKPWAALSADEKRLFVKYQAAYAGFIEHTDVQVGRLLDYLTKSGQIDNTIIIVLSDNGATSEGGLEGFTNMAKGYMAHYMKSSPRDAVKEGLDRIEDIGTERAAADYPSGWAQLGNTPFKLYKEYLFGGGVNDPLIVHWPAGISSKGEIRNQFVDVIDVTPTILDVLGMTAPHWYRGAEQMPLDGKSIVPILNNASAPAQRKTQYFELNGHRAIWHDGWKAVTFHKPGVNFETEKWEVYNVTNDYSETEDLAAREPKRLESLKQLWWKEARARGVLPLSDDPITHLIQSILFKPPVKDLPPLRLYQGQYRIPGEVLADYVSQPVAISVRLNRANSSANGVLLSVGDSDSGWAFYVKDNHLVFDLNVFGKHTVIRSSSVVPVGRSTVRAELTRNTFSIYIDGLNAGTASGSGLQAALYGMLQVGKSVLSPVTWDLLGPSAFPSGGIEEIELTRLK